MAKGGGARSVVPFMTQPPSDKRARASSIQVKIVIEGSSGKIGGVFARTLGLIFHNMEDLGSSGLPLQLSALLGPEQRFQIACMQPIWMDGF
jgi:hypothetical protein